MDIQEMWDRKLKWKTVDDKFNNGEIKQRDTSVDTVTMGPQEIRVYELEYSTATQKFLF